MTDNTPTVRVRAATPEDSAALARLRWTWRVDEQGESGDDQAAFVARLTGINSPRRP